MLSIVAYGVDPEVNNLWHDLPRGDNAAQGPSRSPSGLLFAAYLDDLIAQELTVKYRIRDQTLLLPDGHLLPTFQKHSPTYDMVFDPIYQAIGAQMPDRYFVDVGANVGDTAVVMRYNARNPILCVEGHQPYLECLLKNTEGLSNVSIAPTFVSVDQVANIPLAFTSQGGTGSFSVGSVEDATSTPATKPLATILDEAGALRDGIALFKTDTDGMDAFILQEFLKINANDAAVFFEFDVVQTILKECAEETWRDVFDVLKARGYSLVLFDNFGYQMATCSPGDYGSVWELSRYIEAQFRHHFVHTYYLDVWAFPSAMTSIFEERRTQGPLRALPTSNELVADGSDHAQGEPDGEPLQQRDELSRQLDELRQANSHLQALHDELSRELAEARQANLDLGAAYEKILASRSWRMTKPLRALGTALSRVAR